MTTTFVSDDWAPLNRRERVQLAADGNWEAMLMCRIDLVWRVKDAVRQPSTDDNHASRTREL